MGDREAFIRVNIANDGERGVKIDGGRLLVGGKRIGELTGWAPLSSLERAESTASDLESHPFPVELSSQQSIQLALVLAVDPGSRERYLEIFGEDASPSMQQDARDAIQRAAVRLVLAGEERTFPRVQVAEEAERQWTTSIVTRNGRPTALVVRRTARGRSAQAGPLIVELTLWRDKRDVPRRTTRPLIGKSVRLPLRRLRAGEYWWTVAVAGEVLSSGRGRIPCRAADCADVWRDRQARKQRDLVSCVQVFVRREGFSDPQLSAPPPPPPAEPTVAGPP